MNNEETEQNPTTSATENLIPVFTTDIGGVTQSAVNARELHEFLGSKQDFSSWIKRRLTEYGFVEQVDYQAITKFSDGYKQDKNGRLIDQHGKVIPIEYHLTLDTAKELAMVEKNEKGQQARRYFINCEKQLHAHAETQQPELGYDVSLFTPLVKMVDPCQWHIHQAIEARALFLVLMRLMPMFNTSKLTLSRWSLIVDLTKLISLELNNCVVEKLKVPEDSEINKKGLLLKETLEFIGAWHPNEPSTLVAFYPEFADQLKEEEEADNAKK